MINRNRYMNKLATKKAPDAEDKLIEILLSQGNLDSRTRKMLEGGAGYGKPTMFTDILGTSAPGVKGKDMKGRFSNIMFDRSDIAANSQILGEAINQSAKSPLGALYRYSRLADAPNSTRLFGMVGRDLADSYSSWNALKKTYNKDTAEHKDLLNALGAARSRVLPARLALKTIDEAPRTIGGILGAKYMLGKNKAKSVGGAARIILGDVLGGGLLSAVSSPLKGLASSPLKKFLNSDKTKELLHNARSKMMSTSKD